MPRWRPSRIPAPARGGLADQQPGQREEHQEEQGLAGDSALCSMCGRHQRGLETRAPGPRPPMRWTIRGSGARCRQQRQHRDPPAPARQQGGPGGARRRQEAARPRLPPLAQARGRGDARRSHRAWSCSSPATGASRAPDPTPTRLRRAASAMCRARLIASVSLRWCCAQVPNMRRGRTLPRSGTKARDQLDVFVVDIVDLVRAELADLAAPKEVALAFLLLAGRAAAARVWRLFCLPSGRRPPPPAPPNMELTTSPPQPPRRKPRAPFFPGASPLPLVLRRPQRPLLRSALRRSSSTRTVRKRKMPSVTRMRRSTSLTSRCGAFGDHPARTDPSRSPCRPCRPGASCPIFRACCTSPAFLLHTLTLHVRRQGIHLGFPRDGVDDEQDLIRTIAHVSDPPSGSAPPLRGGAYAPFGPEGP